MVMVRTLRPVWMAFLATLAAALSLHMGADGGDDAHRVLHHLPAPIPVGGDALDAVVHQRASPHRSGTPPAWVRFQKMMGSKGVEAPAGWPRRPW